MEMCYSEGRRCADSNSGPFSTGHKNSDDSSRQSAG